MPSLLASSAELHAWSQDINYVRGTIRSRSPPASDPLRIFFLKQWAKQVTCAQRARPAQCAWFPVGFKSTRTRSGARRKEISCSGALPIALRTFSPGMRAWAISVVCCHECICRPRRNMRARRPLRCCRTRSLLGRACAEHGYRGGERRYNVPQFELSRRFSTSILHFYRGCLFAHVETDSPIATYSQC